LFTAHAQYKGVIILADKQYNIEYNLLIYKRLLLFKHDNNSHLDNDPIHQRMVMYPHHT